VQANLGYNSSIIEPGVQLAFGTNSYVFTGLLAGVNYRFRIASFNLLMTDNMFLPDDYLHFSDPVEFYVANEPSQITVFFQPTVDYISGTVSLQWNSPLNNGSPITKYTLQRDVGVGVFFTIWEGQETTYRDVDLLPGQTYLYRIKASNVIGDGLFSNILTTTASSIPGKITSLSIGLQSKTSLTINWSQPDKTGDLPFTSYYVRHDNADFVLEAPIDNGLSTSFTLTVTQPGNEGNVYRFRVAVANSLGTGPYSDEIRLMATDPPALPTLTTDDSQRTIDSVFLHFAANADDGGSPIIGYLLQRDEGLAGSPFSLIYDGTNKPGFIDYRDLNLQTSLTYTYRLFALNPIFSSTAYAELTLKIGLPPSKPGKPALVSSSLGSTSITIAFSAPE
jgi:hypothetical protein